MNYKAIKINHAEDHVFFSSDFHYQHQKDFVWQKRGFDSFEAHAEHIEKIIDGAPEDSILFYLGDLALNTTDVVVESLLQKMSQKFKKVYYVLGNHESNTTRIFKDKKPENFEVFNYLEIELNKKPICLMHYPIASWNGLTHNSWMIHGHCHGSYKPSLPMSIQGKILDVGIDTHPEKKLWSLPDVISVMANKQFHSEDHH